VLLVDQDVDALAQLAAQLRARGMRVSLASSAQMACERARASVFDVIIASRGAAEPRDGGMGVLDTLSLELASVPPALVLVERGADARGDAHVGRDDLERLVARVEALTGGRARPSIISPSAHALDAGSVADLLLVLGAERRSGTVTVTSPRGSGEVRLVEGDVVDAVYERLEGTKALARMVGEREGTATFAPGAAAIMRRMQGSTRALLAEAREEVERTRERLARAGDLAETAFVAVDGSAESLSGAELHVAARLRLPARLIELLDDLPEPDSVVLETVLGLDQRGKLRRLGSVSSRVQLCGEGQLHLLRASASRARSPGFEGGARLVFAAAPSRLAVFGHTVLSLADALPPSSPAPPIPLPHALASLRLGDGVTLEVVGIPLVPAYAPMWPMAIAGAALIVRLDDGAGEALEAAATSVDVAVLDARAVFGHVDETSAVQVASLIRTAIEADAGAPAA
jgi:CheY-like chemotaxis protein